MKALVLGTDRFLGQFVVDELLARGHEAAALGLGGADLDPSVKRYEGDASDAAALRRALKAWRPDGLIDMVHSGPEHARAVSGVCGGSVARSVHLSCAAVYGPNPVCPVDEHTESMDIEAAPPEVAARIGADRIILEQIERQDLPAVVVRLPEVYGPGDPRCAEWFFARRMLEGRSRIALPDRGLHIAHRGFVQSMAWGVVQALSAPRAAGQIYNLGEEKLYTLAQLARGVARALRCEVELWSVPGHLWTAPYAHTSFCDLRKARAQLRYRDRMIPRDGLEITLAWLCQNPRGEDWSWPGIPAPFDYAREDALIEEQGVRLGD